MVEGALRLLDVMSELRDWSLVCVFMVVTGCAAQPTEGGGKVNSSLNLVLRAGPKSPVLPTPFSADLPPQSCSLFFQTLFGFRLQCVKIRPNGFFGLLVHAIDEKNAMEMIRFMLDSASQQAAATELDYFAFFVERLDLNRLRAGDLAKNLGKT